MVMVVVAVRHSYLLDGCAAADCERRYEECLAICSRTVKHTNSDQLV